jgi:hypothetical protein
MHVLGAIGGVKVKFIGWMKWPQMWQIIARTQLYLPD